MNYAIRHGECLLIPVDTLPKGKLTKGKSVIIGHSETGHHHTLVSKTEFDYLDKAMLYIRLFEPAKLVHQKTVDRHKDLVVPAGIYKVVHKNEYDPWQQVIRRVFD